MFQTLHSLPEDSILGLMAKFRADRTPQKVDLGVGVFRDADGNTPVLECVRRAEQTIFDAQTTKSYVAPAGRAEFNTAVERLVLGKAHSATAEGRTRTVQTPGGCGALRVGAELIKAATPQSIVHVSEPTWGNHTPLLGGAGLKLARYPYYDVGGHVLQFQQMLEAIDRCGAGDVVLLHACCHNPTGADLSPEQWRQLVALLAARKLIPFVDLAYQGFGAGLEEDAYGARLVAETLPEALIAISFSKNLGLYRERTGALITVAESPQRIATVGTHILQIARSIYSMPPDHGAAIVALILDSEDETRAWLAELAEMRTRIQAMRTLLATALRRITGTSNFDFIESQRGMFSLLGVSPQQVSGLREQHHVYMTADSRMNLAGVMPQNVQYLAESIAAILTARAA